MAKWWQRSNTAEIKPIPWLSPRAVEYFESLLTPDMRVLEHGSGGSTLWLASRVESVVSIEQDQDWVGAVKNQAPQNVQVLMTLPEFEQPYDLLLIDGEPLEDRKKYLSSAMMLVRSGGIVILDNANRPQYAEERKVLQEYASSRFTVDTNEPGTSFLVTDFYRLP